MSARPVLPVVRAAELEAPDDPCPWLVEGLWARAGVGILGGAPKVGKTWLGLDLAVSVASATPCLGAFPVADPGDVLVYLAEDGPAVLKARLDGLCHSRGLALTTLPLHVITAPRLRLDLETDQERLDETVRRLRPRLLLLDPLVRLHAIDENSAAEVAALLASLRELQRAHDLAIVLVHHARKNGPAGAPQGLGLRGSGDFFAWADSFLSLRRHRDRLLLTIEHRAAPAPEPCTLALVADAEGRAHLERVEAPEGTLAEDLPEALLAQLRDAPHPLSRTALRTALQVRNERLGTALQRLADAGRIEHRDDGWVLVKPIVPVPTL